MRTWNGAAWEIDGSGTLEVYDILGRRLFIKEIQNPKFELRNSNFSAAGVYLLRLGDRTQKIVIRCNKSSFDDTKQGA